VEFDGCTICSLGVLLSRQNHHRRQSIIWICVIKILLKKEYSSIIQKGKSKISSEQKALHENNTKATNKKERKWFANLGKGQF